MVRLAIILYRDANEIGQRQTLNNLGLGYHLEHDQRSISGSFTNILELIGLLCPGDRPPYPRAEYDSQ